MMISRQNYTFTFYRGPIPRGKKRPEKQKEIIIAGGLLFFLVKTVE